MASIHLMLWATINRIICLIFYRWLNSFRLFSFNGMKVQCLLEVWMSIYWTTANKIDPLDAIQQFNISIIISIYLRINCESILLYLVEIQRIYLVLIDSIKSDQNTDRTTNNIDVFRQIESLMPLHSVNQHRHIVDNI